MTVVVLFGVVATPMALPIPPADAFVRYAAALGQRPLTEEMKAVARLPQFFADMNGWEFLVTTLGDAWHASPAVEQPRAVIVGSNYGEAGAVDVKWYCRARHAPFKNDPGHRSARRRRTRARSHRRRT
jgi:hypothetical protein